MSSSDAGGETGRWWGRRSRGTTVAVGFALVLVVVLVGAAVWLGGSQPVVPTEDPVDAETRAQNTHLTTTLAAADIEVSLVDVTEERVYVAYRLPAFAYDGTGAVDEAAAVELQRFVVGAAADTAPGVERIVVVQYDGEEPRLGWEVRLTDFDAFVAGDLTLEAFEERVQVERYA